MRSIDLINIEQRHCQRTFLICVNFTSGQRLNEKHLRRALRAHSSAQVTDSRARKQITKGKIEKVKEEDQDAQSAHWDATQKERAG
jgi:hypothetical protein